MSSPFFLKNIRHTAAAICLMATAVACSGERPDEVDIVVLYTTDVHGACLPFDFNRNAPARTSLANVSTYVDDVRRDVPDGVMLFDTGDFLQGQPSVYYYNYVATDTTHIVSRVANYLGYDALGVGNHDIETGEAVYHDRLPRELEMPWLCANAIDTRTGRPMFTPYTVIRRQGIRIAVLGMITPNIAAWLPRSLWPNLEFQDMVECAEHWVPIIQEREHPDLLIGLFHSGGDYTVGGADIDTYKNENGGVPVAIRVPGFDLILLGHDHQPRQFSVVNVAGDTVPVLDAQTQAARVGRADIHLSRVGGRYTKSVTTSLVDMKGVEANTDFAAIFADDIERVNAYVDRPLGTLTDTLRAEPGLVGPSEFMDLIHDAQLWATGADISFASLLSAHAVIPAGPLTMRHLFTLYKYENLLCRLRMTGDEVRRYLEYGFGQQFNVMRNADDHLLAFRLDSTGQVQQGAFGPELVTPTFNYTSAAGIRYVIDVHRPVGQRVYIYTLSDGRAFHPDSLYTVTLNSYQASGGGGFIPVGLGWDKDTLAARTLATAPRDVRSCVADYIEHVGEVRPHLRGDWEIVPHAWWRFGAAQDLPLLNPDQR